MHCRSDVVLLALASGLMLLSISVIFLTAIIPFGMGGWLVSLAAFWWGMPLALILALCTAIDYFSGRRPASREKAD